MLISYLILPLGDYCWGIAHGLWLMLLIGIFLIFFIYFLILEIIADYKDQRKFDFGLIVIPLFFLSLIIYIFNISGEKFWTETKLIGQIEIDGPRNAEFKLYTNNSFSARISFIGFSCTVQGKYQIKGEILILKKENLIGLTDSLFTTEYKLDSIESTLSPLNPNFGVIKIKN